jgi:hypothetical protein
MHGTGNKCNPDIGKHKKNTRKNKADDRAYDTCCSDAVLILLVSDDSEDESCNTKDHAYNTRAAAKE